MIVIVIVYVASPITHNTYPDTGLDFSPRYYELRSKSSLSKEEYKELQSEKCKYGKSLIEYFNSEDYELFEDIINEYNDNCSAI